MLALLAELAPLPQPAKGGRVCNAPGPSRFFGDLKRPKEMLLTVPELAEYLRIHSSTVYRLLRCRKIPGFEIGGDWRFSIEEIDRWRTALSGTGTVKAKPQTQPRRSRSR